MSSRGARLIICEIGCRYDSPVIREAEAFVCHWLSATSVNRRRSRRAHKTDEDGAYDVVERPRRINVTTLLPAAIAVISDNQTAIDP